MSNPFLDMKNKLAEGKDLSEVVVGNAGKYLGEGVHEVSLQAVDAAEAAEELKIKVTYADADEKSHNENIFLLNRDKTELGFGFRQLLGGLFGDDKNIQGTTETFEKVLELVGSGDYGILEAFTGMKTKIRLERADTGFVITTNGNKKFIAKEGDEIVSDAFDTAKEAREDAKAKGKKPAFINVRGMDCIDAENNVKIFNTAVSQRAQAKTGSGSVGQSIPGANVGVVTKGV